jgi:hypothetical protein
MDILRLIFTSDIYLRYQPEDVHARTYLARLALIQWGSLNW